MSTRITTIHGYVQALPRASQRDEAAKIALVTDNGDIYHILHKAAGVDLIDHISSTVEGTGTVTPIPVPEGTERDVNEFFLLVRSYRLRDDFENSWYDDPEE